MAQIHEYPIHIEWTGGRQGAGKITSKNSNLELDLAVPIEFRGTGKGVNPEELLTQAVAGCFNITYGIMAEMKKIPLISLSTEAIGQVLQDGMKIVFKSICLKPIIILESNSTTEQKECAITLAYQAEQQCLISQSLKGNVTVNLEPKIITK